MEDRTRAYLRGRFRDHYRRTAVAPPPDANEREWGYIPWTRGSGTTMVRHKSLLDLGGVDAFLERERPRHVYYSAGRYRHPGANSMGRKEWRSSDLIFDLDADHLPGVDPDADTYGEMLAVCKDALGRLLAFLEDDFGFEDLTVVFSGGRGYHVHVRDDTVLDLGRGARREIVDYVRGIGLDDVDPLLDRETVAGSGVKNPVEKRLLRTDGGWGRRVHAELMAFVDEIRDLDDADALERLTAFDGIGEKSAKQFHAAATDRYDEFTAGNLDVTGGGAALKLARHFLDVTVENAAAPIDEPVTTDINRLIRLPGSLHGGTGLQVREIARDALDAFDPLVDAIPGTFQGNEIAIEATEDVHCELGGDTFTVPRGEATVPEYVGIFAMTRGAAEKGKE